MIELTLQQRQTVAQEKETPPRAVDPDTDTTYVLIKEEVYLRLKALLEEPEGSQFLDDMYPSVMEVFRRDGWDDPAMDIYNDLDPPQPPPPLGPPHWGKRKGGEEKVPFFRFLTLVFLVNQPIRRVSKIILGLILRFFKETRFLNLSLYCKQLILE